MGTLAVLLPTNLISLTPSLRTADPFAAEGWYNALEGSYPSSDAEILAGLQLGLAYSVPEDTIRNITAIFAYDDPEAEIFILDGAPAVKLSDLPPGFIMRGKLTGSLNGQGLSAGSTINFSVAFGETISGTGTFPPDSFQPFDEFVSPGVPFTHDDAYILPDVFMAIQLTISINGINSADFVQPFGIGALFGGDPELAINGDFTIEESFQWNLSQDVSPVHGSNTIDPPDGSQITVTSDPDDPNPLDFTQVETVTLNYTDSNGDEHNVDVPPELWITIEIFIFIFYLPILPTDPEPPPVITVIITGTQFTGTVTLGKMATIYFFNAPGIYSLTPGATHDVLYDVLNGGTVTVKIPNPFAKTGFIGG